MLLDLVSVRVVAQLFLLARARGSGEEFACGDTAKHLGCLPVL